jgi:hypothetical protein
MSNYLENLDDLVNFVQKTFSSLLSIFCLIAFVIETIRNMQLMQLLKYTNVYFEGENKKTGEKKPQVFKLDL